jgi:membrane-associated phospholipid phosphatase
MKTFLAASLARISREKSSAIETALPWAQIAPTPSLPSLSRVLEIARAACGAFEWVTFAYLAWLGAIFITCHRRIAHVAPLIAIHAAIALAILALAIAAQRRQHNFIRLARHWYPLALYIFFFEELQNLVQAIFPRWFDRFLIQFDFHLAGVHPSLWFARFASPALNDFMQFAYMTYFLYLVLLPAILYASRERLAFWTTMVSTAIAHYSVYVVAILFPVESPFYSLASLQSKPLAGGTCTALIDLIEHFGRVHGAAFPSAHVAGSTVALLAAWRYRRWLFWVCLPFFASMCVATVYGRYHYVADVFAGLAVGGIAFLAGTRLMQLKGSLPQEGN